MTNFWNTSDGKEIEKTTSFDASAMTPIPDGTNCKVVIDEAGWKAAFDHHDPEMINLRLTVLDPKEFKGRKVFQKVRVNDVNPDKADKAKRMLMAIDQIAGGKLAASGKEPSDDELMGALVNKIMVVKLGVWDMNDKQGNWVMAVSPVAKAAPKNPASERDISSDDEPVIPF
jgi:hypothetical protein